MQRIGLALSLLAACLVLPAQAAAQQDDSSYLMLGTWVDSTHAQPISVTIFMNPYSTRTVGQTIYVKVSADLTVEHNGSIEGNLWKGVAAVRCGMKLGKGATEPEARYSFTTLQENKVNTEWPQSVHLDRWNTSPDRMTNLLVSQLCY